MKKLILLLILVIGCATTKPYMTFKMVHSEKDYMEVYTCFQAVANKFSKDKMDTSFGSSQVNVNMGESTIIFSYPKSMEEGSNITVIEPTDEIMKYINECKGKK